MTPFQTKALEHLVNKNFSALASLAQTELQNDPSSHPAAVCYFLSLWYQESPDFASKFMLHFVDRNGASENALYCTIIALLRLQPGSDVLMGLVDTWLKTLPTDDIRRDGFAEGELTLSLLERKPLAAKSSSVSPSIEDAFGKYEGFLSSHKKMVSHHWSKQSFHSASNVNISTIEWVVFDDQYAFVDDTFSSAHLMDEPRLFQKPVSRSVLFMSPRHVIMQTSHAEVSIDRPCILVGDNKNYYYWLFHHLARLRALEGTIDFRAQPLLVNEDLSDLQIESLRTLGITDDMLIRCPPNTTAVCESLTAPARLACSEAVHPAAVRWVRERFGPASRDPKYPKRIFVTRTKPHRRRFENEDEVFDALKPLGFEKIAPDNLSFDEQSRAFQNADIVVSPFGTCLTGTVFAPATCTVFEIIEDDLKPAHRFIENIARILGQDLKCISAEKADNQEFTEQNAQAFTVAPSLVLETVLAATDGPSN